MNELPKFVASTPVGKKVEIVVWRNGKIMTLQVILGELEKAEIVGFKNGNNCLSLFQPGAQVKSGSKVFLLDDGYSISVGENLLGRVIDALGNSLDGKANPLLRETWPLNGVQLNPIVKKKCVATVRCWD